MKKINLLLFVGILFSLFLVSCGLDVSVEEGSTIEVTITNATKVHGYVYEGNKPTVATTDMRAFEVDGTTPSNHLKSSNSSSGFIVIGGLEPGLDYSIWIGDDTNFNVSGVFSFTAPATGEKLEKSFNLSK